MILEMIIAAGVLALLNSGSSIKFIRPVNGVITSPYGSRYHNGSMQFHNGIDIAVPVGTPVLSPLDGEVVSIYLNEKGGKQVLVRHAGGIQTGYAHLSAYNVSVGQVIRRGQKIAFTGNTGDSTGPHLHFTVRVNGILVNPQKFL